MSTESPAAPALRTRVEPVIDADGKPVELNPPSAGRWLRHADGGLDPADAETAAAAGLAWPGAFTPNTQAQSE